MTKTVRVWKQQFMRDIKEAARGAGRKEDWRGAGGRGQEVGSCPSQSALPSKLTPGKRSSLPPPSLCSSRVQEAARPPSRGGMWFKKTNRETRDKGQLWWVGVGRRMGRGLSL